MKVAPELFNPEELSVGGLAVEALDDIQSQLQRNSLADIDLDKLSAAIR